MLITDGAADTYSDVFHELNPDKRVRLISVMSDQRVANYLIWNLHPQVRLFTYLIGLEAHEAPNVRSMACENRGHFVHIANDADIQANIHVISAYQHINLSLFINQLFLQHYVNRMSRPLAMHRINTPVWSSIYFDQLVNNMRFNDRNLNH